MEPEIRWRRARDWTLTALAGACFSFAFFFLAGWLWFRGLLAAASIAHPLLWAAGFAAAAGVLGILHTYLPPPCSPSTEGRIRSGSDR